MKTISGLFDTHEEARKAVDALEDAGIASDDISIIGPDDDTVASGAAEGAGIGAAVGGVGGLLAGLGAFAIPGIGPVVGAGWLATTLAGMAAGGLAGGLVGSLTEAGVDDRDALSMPKASNAEAPWWWPGSTTPRQNPTTFTHLWGLAWREGR